MYSRQVQVIPILVVFLFFSNSTNAQNITKLENPILVESATTLKSCATPAKTNEQRRYTLNVVDQRAQSRNGGLTSIPIRAHIINKNDGSGGISLGNINIGISYLNSFYYDAGIEFYLCSQNIINSTAWWDFDQSEENAMVSAHSVDDAVNIYFVDTITTSSGGSACGYAYYPANADYSINILMRNDCTVGSPNGTLSHELGHFFDLAHTHAGTEDGNLDSNAEHVPRSGANSNCATKGDQLCDTPADPNGSNDANCNFINDGEDQQDFYSNVYSPDLDNVMSYYSDFCGGSFFTAGQYGRISAAVTERLSHTAYNLDGCAPTVVTDPSGLTVTLNNSYGVDLNWTDNANNELGYLIERSTDSGASWKVVVGGGVAPNITSFTDAVLESNTTYSYRVKASNDDANDYSNEASISVGLVYCTPSHQFNNCDPNGVGIGIAVYSFEFEEAGTNLINNPNNGCNGPLAIYSPTHSAAVFAGESYDVIVNFQVGGTGGFFNQFVAVWVDNNQNGSFEDSGEMLYQAMSVAGPTVTAPITLPATILEGNTTLRVRTGWSGGGVVDDPCDYRAFSETEEYELVVTNLLPVSIIDFNAQLQEEQVVLDWSTETEINNDYFVVERSLDGSNFERIGKVKGAGSINTPQTYELIDPNPANGTNYYRLVQFDYNGSFEMLERVIAVDYNPEQQVVSVQPNPSQGNHIQLVYESKHSGNLEVQIFDITGKLLMDFDFNTSAKRDIFDISLSNISKGVYVIKTTGGGNSQSLRFIKSN